MMRDRKFKVLLLTVAMLLVGCASTETGDIPESTAHVHSYEQTVIKATYTSESYTLNRCTCGEGYKDSYTKMPAEVVSGLAQKDYLPFEGYSRARTENPEFVMVHFTSAVVLSKKDPYSMDTIRSIFEDYKVSIHYIIDRDGKILCYIPEDLVAYHAGYGSWKDDPKYADNLNNYSIGIELAAIGSASEMAQYLTEKEYQSLSPELIGYTDAQYAALKSLVSDICARNDIPVGREHIIGHEEYYPKKTDPGELFDWARLFS